MAAANPLWREPRLHAELQMLGIVVSERTVSRILRGLPRPPSQTWRTFLHNHMGQIVSIDFFTVPTVTLRVLFVFFVLDHHRRQVLHFAVNERPTVAWTSQQIVNAFADREAPRYLIRDRDSIYGSSIPGEWNRSNAQHPDFAKGLCGAVSTSSTPSAPKRVRTSAQYFVILSARHLRRTLTRYFDYYHRSRPTYHWANSAPSRVRSSPPDALFAFRNSVVYTTGTNVLPHDMQSLAFILATGVPNGLGQVAARS